MIDEILLTLLDASAHEIMSRSPWLFRGSPTQKAAAAGYLAWRDACVQQSLVYAAGFGSIAIIGATLWRYGMRA
jgi:hypothetical protein